MHVPGLDDDLPPRPWPDATRPTGEQVATWLESFTHEQLVAWAAARSWIAAREARCFLEGHDSRLRRLQQQLDDRVKDL